MEYARHLSTDPVMQQLIQAQGPVSLKQEKDIYLYLCYSIMSQQLSTRVADVLRERFLALYGKRKPSAQAIADTPFEQLRAIGLSNAKVHYVQNVARFELTQGMQAKKLQTMSNDEIKTYLTSIKGVGNWTVEMLLMFALGREDVFAPDDLGIQQAIRKLYRIRLTDKRKFKMRMETISKKWAPYRTYACIHLWRHKDGA